MKPNSSRRGLYLLFFLLLSLAGCSKDDVTPSSDTKSRLIGRWRLQQTSGGIGGGTQPADPARRQELVFTEDGQAQFLVNGTAEITTGYAVRQVQVPSTGKEEVVVNFGAPLSSYQMVMTIRQLTATQLSLDEAYDDGRRYDYIRP